jgi:hypothetical protein
MPSSESEAGMRILASMLLVWAVSTGPAWSGPSEDAALAHEQKDYATALRLAKPLAASR